MRDESRLRAAPGVVLLLAVVVATALGCDRRGGDPQALETGTVPPPPDAGLVVEDAAPATPSEAGGLAGALPADFPADVPVPRPASVVDVGPGWVVLYAVDAPDQVRDRLDAALVERGWVAQPLTGAGARPYSKGGRTLRMTVGPGPGGAEVRLDWAR